MGGKQHLWILALGGNLPSEEGTPEITLRAALKRLEDDDIRIVQVSRFLRPRVSAGCRPGLR